MPRANRHVIAGQIWHLTHRCHKKQWLLKFAHDRRRWMYWLFEARRRFGLIVLNYVVTSNHVHLLVMDDGRSEIQSAMQLIAGRTAQKYNLRKNRKGAFWEDRYHSTAVQSDTHLQRCITYIDLNMVRAGVVSHPSHWLHGGLFETLKPRSRYSRLHLEALMKLMGHNCLGQHQQARQEWIVSELDKGPQSRDPIWSSAVAVGSETYVNSLSESLAIRQPGRKVRVKGDDYFLKEPLSPLYRVFGTENTF